jgi:hypothetical protein
MLDASYGKYDRRVLRPLYKEFVDLQHSNVIIRLATSYSRAFVRSSVSEIRDIIIHDFYQLICTYNYKIVNNVGRYNSVVNTRIKAERSSTISRLVFLSSHHITSHHITSHHITSHHITSH